MHAAKKNVPTATNRSRRAEIIRISTEVFLDRGFSGSSMAQLAAACGIQKASFYHHFKNKDELFIACVINGYDSAIDALSKIEADETLSDVERIKAALIALYDITVDTPTGRLSPLIAEVSRSMPDLSEKFFTDYIAVQRTSLKRMVMKGVENGSFTEPDFDVLYHLVFGPIVTLSLSLEMFTKMDALQDRFPKEKVRDGHIAALLLFLRGQG